MAIPEGYRLLTAEDVGKVFGVDLETTLYIDTDVDISNESYFIQGQTTNLTNFIQASKLYDSNYEFYMPRIFWDSITIVGLEDNLAWEGSIGWMNIEGRTILANEGLEITSFNTDYNWNNWFYVKDKADPKTQFITDMNGLAESIVGKAGSSGKKTIKEMKTLVDGLKTEFVTQEKTVTPTTSSQSITPDSGKDGLSKVTVEAIPTDYIIPSGTLEVIENGEVDCSSYEKVNVNVPSEEPTYWDGSYTESDSKGYTVTLKFTAVNNISYTVDDGETITTDVTSSTEIPLQVSSSLKIKANDTALDYNNESNLNVITWNTPNATWIEGIYTITEDCTITLGYSSNGNPEPI